MSHDLEAAYAAAEVAAQLQQHPEHCFLTVPARANLSAYAAREGRHAWPHADGVVELMDTTGAGRSFNLALEFKRPNEGLHGILTAIGQSHAYLRKGYAGAVIVIPERYPGLNDSGSYVSEVLNLTSKAEAIGVFSYKPPDLTLPSPFAGRITLGRRFKVDAAPPIAAALPLSRTETQWAHVREGSTDPDAFFRYLQAVKILSGTGSMPPPPVIPVPIADAVARLAPGVSPEIYLSNAPNNAMADRAWRLFWFSNVLNQNTILPWSGPAGSRVLNETKSNIMRSDGKGEKAFFVGKSNSPRNKIFAELEDGLITNHQALEKMVQNYRGRAHSYREDIDSGAEHLGFIDSDGRLTDDGYRYVDACERSGDANNGLPRSIFMGAVLREGGLGAFLHYIHRLSDERFRRDPLAFTANVGGRLKFDTAEYLVWLEDEMANRLHVMRKVAARGGQARKAFQAELAILRNLSIVRDFRIGVGLVINWPELQEALEFSNMRSSRYP